MFYNIFFVEKRPTLCSKLFKKCFFKIIKNQIEKPLRVKKFSYLCTRLSLHNLFLQLNIRIIESSFK